MRLPMAPINKITLGMWATYSGRTQLVSRSKEWEGANRKSKCRRPKLQMSHGLNKGTRSRVGIFSIRKLIIQDSFIHHVSGSAKHKILLNLLRAPQGKVHRWGRAYLKEALGAYSIMGSHGAISREACINNNKWSRRSNNNKWSKIKRRQNKIWKMKWKDSFMTSTPMGWRQMFRWLHNMQLPQMKRKIRWSPYRISHSTIKDLERLVELSDLDIRTCLQRREMKRNKLS